MSRTNPPFRADHVGSLLRPAALKAARGKHERGEITAAELAAIEDDEIKKVIRKQEEIGLRSVTDGEFRRAFWNYDFLGKLEGVEAYLGERKIKFHGPQLKPMMLRVTGKLETNDSHPMIEHFKFVAAHAKATPKMTIPSPSCRLSLSPARRGQFHLSLRSQAARLRRRSRRRPADAGTCLCGHDQCSGVRRPCGDDQAMHLCRGNFQSTFVASGGYEPVAEILFNAIDIDAYFMEYDSE